MVKYQHFRDTPCVENPVRKRSWHIQTSQEIAGGVLSFHALDKTTGNGEQCWLICDSANSTVDNRSIRTCESKSKNKCFDKVVVGLYLDSSRNTRGCGFQLSRILTVCLIIWTGYASISCPAGNIMILSQSRLECPTRSRVWQYVWWIRLVCTHERVLCS